MRPERALIADVLRRRARPVAAGCAASTVHQTCEALVPLAIGLAVDHAIDGAPPVAVLIAVAGVLLLFTVLATGGGVAGWVLGSTCLTEAHDLRVRAIGRVLADPLVGRDRRAGELMSILTSDTKATADVMRVLANLTSGCAGLVVAVVVLLRVDLWLGLGIVVVLPLLVLGIDRLGPWLERKVRARQQAGGLAAALAAELIHALRPLRSFGGVPEAVRRYRLTSGRSLHTALDTASATAVVAVTGLLATGLVLVGTAAAAGTMALSGRITVGEFVTVIVMASFVADPVRRIANGVEQVAVSRAGAARVAALLSAPTRSTGGGAPDRPGPLTVRDVAVGPVTGLDFTLGAGEVLGIATADPATADAVTTLLAGRTAPASGRVSFGDVAMESFDLKSLRRHVLVEPHTAHLLGGTLDAVLDTGRGTDRATVDRALAAAGADDLDQYASDGGYVLEGGANLSGGQRQRVALARAMAAEPPVLVLRDPLTAVDAVTEDAVADGLHALRRNGCAGTVVITTSPPLLSRCDRVVFLDGGAAPVVATHAQLTANPAYAEAVLR
ncbi:ABC transporter ATP-binding protein [Umezawaea sp. Da 62-37]|uniref:ABC transporter ATP-binding protein n=1 Tax=Umezawaea sp. Da 62-37 TaxID=3075927 RepID=UPI0028F6E4F8|nr:ABC transporter ATP-binding protein [Umezawaea sp. Da 62-37]WNV88120.1 ABC transporter ATP-binding protein [Umezawaea sp. Da 62-37]